MIVINFDGLCEPNPGGVACYGWIATRDGEPLGSRHGVARRGAGATNNVAEYTAALESLRWAEQAGYRDVELRGDSKLVVEQVSGRWRVNSPALALLCRQVRARLDALGGAICWVPRDENAAADQLSRTAYVEETGHAPPERQRRGRAA